MNIRLIIKGMRPKTLAAGIVPPICAFSLLGEADRGANFIYLVLCILLAIFIQVATNFYNDAIDYLKGADEDRVGPQRISTQGSVNHKEVLLFGHIFILLALIVGVPLVMKGGIAFFFLGVISLSLAYGYTGGPYPLAYLGLGEVFVFLFFGLLATCGSYFLFKGAVPFEVFLLGTQLGLLSCVLISINNFRDTETDRLVNKRTLATRMNKEKYLLLIDLFLFLPYFLLLYFVLFVDLKFFFPLFAISLAYKIKNTTQKASLSELNNCLALAGKHLLLFSILFSLASLCR